MIIDTLVTMQMGLLMIKVELSVATLAKMGKNSDF